MSHSIDDIVAFAKADLEKQHSMPPMHAFSREEYAARHTALRAAMRAEGIELLLLSAPDSVCYMHGYALRWYKAQSPAEWPPLMYTAVHVDHDDLVHFDWYGEENALRLTSVIEDVRFYPGDSWAPVEGDTDGDLAFLLSELRNMGWLRGRVGLELAAHVPSPAHSAVIRAALEASGCEVVDGTMLLRNIRTIKSPQEIAYIEEAAAIADKGILAVQAALRPGVTELELWGEQMAAMSRAGGEHAALHECVLAGGITNGHRMASRRRLADGDFVVADPCGVVNRYHSNITRMLYVGDAPPPEAERLLELAAGGFAVLTDVAKIGTPFTAVNRALREYYQDAGIWELRSWVGGYELGLSLAPDWVGAFQFTVEDETDERVVQEGLVTNFESIFHLPVLDTFVFEAGGARRLSSLGHALLTSS